MAPSTLNSNSEYYRGTWEGHLRRWPFSFFGRPAFESRLPIARVEFSAASRNLAINRLILRNTLSFSNGTNLAQNRLGDFTP